MAEKTKLAFNPLYAQVRTSILERIISGEWGPGTFLPSEIALAKEYGVSQGTLRKALNDLTREKRLVRYQGRGTAVAVLDEDSGRFPFFRLVSRNGKQSYPVSHAYSIKMAKADADESEYLNIDQGSSVIHIDRIRMIDDSPVINERIALSAQTFPKFPLSVDKLPNTIYGHYQTEYGIMVRRVVEQLDVVVPDANDVRQLNLKNRKQSLLQVTRIAYDMQDNPVELRRSRVDTSQYFYRNELI